MPAADVIAWFESPCREFLEKISKSAKKLARDVSDAVHHAWDTISSGARHAWESVSNTVASVPQWIKDAAKDVIWIKEVILKGPAAITEMVGNIVNSIGTFVSSIFKSIYGFAYDVSGPLAPVTIVVIAGGAIWFATLLAKRLYELL